MFGSRAGAEKNNFCAILFSDLLANIILRFPWVVNQQTLTFPFVHFFLGGGRGAAQRKPPQLSSKPKDHKTQGHGKFKAVGLVLSIFEPYALHSQG